MKERQYTGSRCNQLKCSVVHRIQFFSKGGEHPLPLDPAPRIPRIQQLIGTLTYHGYITVGTSLNSDVTTMFCVSAFRNTPGL